MREVTKTVEGAKHDVSPSVSTEKPAQMLEIQRPKSQNPLKMVCSTQYLRSIESNHPPDPRHQMNKSIEKNYRWKGVDVDDSRYDHGGRVMWHCGCLADLSEANPRQLSSGDEACG